MSTSSSSFAPSSKAVTSVAMPHVHPLDEFYALASLQLPPIEAISGDAVPEPYKTLLVHNDDMTPTLEKFHQCQIHLRVLGRQQRQDAYYREVILVTDQIEKPVEFGAIKINLNLFEPSTRRAILEEKLPLGHILADHAVKHGSRPKAFLKVVADPLISRAFSLTSSPILYGRRNTISDPAGKPLAEIVEILPPAN